jgi:hypothetical protein
MLPLLKFNFVFISLFLSHIYTHAHTYCAAVAPSVVGSVVGSAEYSAAMELEMWKLTEEEAFQEQLKAREKTHMAKLGGIKLGVNVLLCKCIVSSLAVQCCSMLATIM